MNIKCYLYGSLTQTCSKHIAFYTSLARVNISRHAVKFKMGKGRYLTTADFHLPTGLVGATLLPGVERDYFKIIRNDIDIYIKKITSLCQLMKLVDSVEETKRLGHRRSMIILSHIMTYLRIKLLSHELRVIELSAIMIDTLVKNGQYRIHILVGNRIFMKTIRVIIRQLLADERLQCRRVGFKILDFLKGWGEAFSKGERRLIYPHIVTTYEKMRHKYGVTYQRPDFDPLRVPIFLGTISSYEISRPHQNDQQLSSEELDNSSWESESIGSESSCLHENSTSFCDEKESPVDKIGRLKRMYAARAAESRRNQHELSFESGSPVRWIQTLLGWQMNSEELAHADDILRSPGHRNQAEAKLSCHNKSTTCLAQQTNSSGILSRYVLLDNIAITQQARCDDFMECIPCNEGIDYNRLNDDCGSTTNEKRRQDECESINAIQTELNCKGDTGDKLITESKPTGDSTCCTDEHNHFEDVAMSVEASFAFGTSLFCYSSPDPIDTAAATSLLLTSSADVDSHQDGVGELSINNRLSPTYRYFVNSPGIPAAKEMSREGIEDTNDSLTAECDATVRVNHRVDEYQRAEDRAISAETSFTSRLSLLCDDNSASPMDTEDKATMIETSNQPLESVWSISKERINSFQRRRKSDVCGSEAEYASGSNPMYSNGGGPNRIVRYSTISMSPSNERRGKARYLSPSCDSTLEVKYFGHQRVLVKSDRKWL